MPHVPGHGTEEEDSGPQSLQNLHGQIVFLPSGEAGYLFIDRRNNQFLMEVGDGQVRLLPQGTQVQTRLGQIIDIGRGLSFTTRNLPSSQVFGSSGSSGTSAPAFSSTREAIELEHQNRIAELQEQARLAERQGRIEDARRFRQELQLEQQRHRNQLDILGREQTFQERLGLLEQLSTLAQQASQFQTQAGQQAVELTGQDPLRAAIGLQGGVQRGVTPNQALRGRLLGLAQAQLPQPNVNAQNPALRRQVGQFQEFLQTPIIQPSFGLAGGGVIELEPSDEASFALAEGTGVLVGERAPEVIVREGGKLRVIPLAAQAQFGLDFSNFQPTNTPSFQALSPLFAHLGLNAPPTVQRGAGELRRGFGLSNISGLLGGGIGAGGIGGLAEQSRSFSTGDIFRQLGIRPRLVGNPRTGTIGFINDQGQIQHIPNMQAMEAMGFRPEDVLSLSGDPLQELASLGVTGVGSPLTQLSDVQPFEQLAQFGQPIIMPTDPLGVGTEGLLLPAPETVAALLPRLDPTTAETILQAYALAGIPREAILSRVEAFTPSGSARFGLAGAPRIG